MLMLGAFLFLIMALAVLGQTIGRFTTRAVSFLRRRP